MLCLDLPFKWSYFSELCPEPSFSFTLHTLSLSSLIHPYFICCAFWHPFSVTHCTTNTQQTCIWQLHLDDYRLSKPTVQTELVNFSVHPCFCTFSYSHHLITCPRYWSNKNWSDCLTSLSLTSDNTLTLLYSPLFGTHHWCEDKVKPSSRTRLPPLQLHLFLLLPKSFQCSPGELLLSLQSNGTLYFWVLEYGLGSAWQASLMSFCLSCFPNKFYFSIVIVYVSCFPLGVLCPRGHLAMETFGLSQLGGDSIDI